MLLIVKYNLKIKYNVFPIQILNQYAITMLVYAEYSEKHFSSAKIKIEFYDENKKAIHMMNYLIQVQMMQQ